MWRLRCTKRRVKSTSNASMNRSFRSALQRRTRTETDDDSEDHLHETITLESNSDADFAADKNDRKSLTGYVILLHSMLVIWSAKKQSGVSLSKMEEEFVAASKASRGLRSEMFREIHMKPVLTTHACQQSDGHQET